MASAARTTGVVYERCRPEETTLYEIVRDNVETLNGAIDDGAIAVRIPKHATKELRGTHGQLWRSAWPKSPSGSSDAP